MARRRQSHRLKALMVPQRQSHDRRWGICGGGGATINGGQQLRDRIENARAKRGGSAAVVSHAASVRSVSAGGFSFAKGAVPPHAPVEAHERSAQRLASRQPMRRNNRARNSSGSDRYKVIVLVCIL
jgi:hypothetical protein